MLDSNGFDHSGCTAGLAAHEILWGQEDKNSKSGFNLRP